MSEHDRYTIRLPFLRTEARRPDLGRMDEAPNDEQETVARLGLIVPLGVVPVTGASQVPIRRAVHRIARYFNREFGYDGVQYNSRERDSNTETVAFIWTKSSYHDRYHEGGVFAFGACCFRWRTYKDQVSSWALQWAWFHGYERRKGHLSKAWPFFEARFGHFDVERPLSPAMQSFVAKMARR